MNRSARLLSWWLIVAVAVTCLAFITYAGLQQVLRQSANDPQIALAEDAAAALQRGAQPAEVVGAQQVEIEQGLSPFLIIFDTNGNPVASSGVLGGSVPTLPAGVLEYTVGHGQDRITWQPRFDARIAAVIQHYGGASPGFVLAGRSLREVERREDAMLAIVALGLLGTLGVTFVVAIAAGFLLAVVEDKKWLHMARRNE